MLKSLLTLSLLSICVYAAPVCGPSMHLIPAGQDYACAPNTVAAGTILGNNSANVAYPFALTSAQVAAMIGAGGGGGQSVGSSGAVQSAGSTAGSFKDSGCINPSSGNITCNSFSVSGTGASYINIFDAGPTNEVLVTVPSSVGTSYAIQLPGAPPSSGQTNSFAGVGSGATAGGVTAASGVITAIANGATGSGYGTTAPLCQIADSAVPPASVGSGAVCHATLSAGSLASIVVDKGGSGYTTPVCTLIPVAVESFVSPGGSTVSPTGYALWGSGDTTTDITNLYGPPYSGGGAAHYGLSVGFTVQAAMTFGKLATYSTRACSSGSCAALIGIFSSTYSPICVMTVDTTGTTGVKVVTPASGSGVSGSTCTLPAGGYYLVSTSDDGNLGMAGILSSNTTAIGIATINANNYGYAAAVSTGTVGSLVFNSLTSITWLNNTNLGSANSVMPSVQVGN